MSGLYGNKLLNTTNILYDINLKQEYERTYRELSLMIGDGSYVLESNINDKVNIIINKIKELWNIFKTFVKDCFKKLKDFIKKILKIKLKNKNKEENNMENNNRETYSEYRERTHCKIKYYKFKEPIDLVKSAAQVVIFTSYNIYLKKGISINCMDIKESDLNDWFKEKIKECINESDKEFEEHKNKISISDNSFYQIDKWEKYEDLSECTKSIYKEINTMKKYIEYVNEGLDKAEEQIKKYEDKLNKSEYNYSSIYNLAKSEYKLKLLQHDIPLMKDHVMLCVNNTKIVSEKYQYNLREYNRLIDMI